jgi:hypothetical protein
MFSVMGTAVLSSRRTGGRLAIASRTPASVNRPPTSDPLTTIHAVSASIGVASRNRVAPSALRTASSRRRPVTRAISRPERFTQIISAKSAAPAMANPTAEPAWLRNRDTPRCNGSSANSFCFTAGSSGSEELTYNRYSSARAAAGLTSGFNLPTSSNGDHGRSSGFGNKRPVAPSGIRMSGPDSTVVPLKPRGRTPVMINGTPRIVTGLPITSSDP